MADHPYPTFYLNGVCVCGWRWRVQYRLKCSDSEGAYQDGECDWEEVEDSEEAVGTSLEDPVLTWKWDEQNEDGASCSGWLYGPKHMDCQVGRISGQDDPTLPDYDEDDLPDVNDVPTSDYCEDCCKCKRWKRDYEIECDPFVEGQPQTCHWVPVPGSDDKVDCPAGSNEDYPGIGYFEPSEDGTAILYGPPHGVSEIEQEPLASTPDFDLDLVEDPEDCTPYCECVQWQRRYYFKCADDKDDEGNKVCWWSSVNPDSGEETKPFLGKCSSYEGVWHDEGDFTTGMRYGGRYPKGDAPATADDDPDYVKVIPPLIPTADCNEHCECVQLVKYYDFRCNPDLTCEWVPAVDNDGEEADPQEIECYGDYEGWHVLSAYSQAAWFGKQHWSGVIPPGERFDPIVPKISAAECANNCICWQYTLAWHINYEDDTWEDCQWWPNGCEDGETGEDCADINWVKCVGDYDNTFHLDQDECSGVFYGPRVVNGIIPPRPPTNDLSPDVAPKCEDCADCQQWSRHFDMVCDNDVTCRYDRQNPDDAVLGPCNALTDDDHIDDDEDCNGITMLGPKHYKTPPSTDDSPVPPALDGDFCERCCGCKQWTVEVTVKCEEDGSCSYDVSTIDNDWVWGDCEEGQDGTGWTDAVCSPGSGNTPAKYYGDFVYGDEPDHPDITTAPAITPTKCAECCPCKQWTLTAEIICEEDGSCSYDDTVDWVYGDCDQENNDAGWVAADCSPGSGNTPGVYYGPCYCDGEDHAAPTFTPPAVSLGKCTECCPCSQWAQDYELDCTVTPCAFKKIGTESWITCKDESPEEGGWVPATGCGGGTMYGAKYDIEDTPLSEPSAPSGSICSDCCDDGECYQWRTKFRIKCDHESATGCSWQFDGATRLGPGGPSWIQACKMGEYSVSTIYSDQIFFYGKWGTKGNPSENDATKAKLLQMYPAYASVSQTVCNTICPSSCWARHYKLKCKDPQGSGEWYRDPYRGDYVTLITNETSEEYPRFVVGAGEEEDPDAPANEAVLYGVRWGFGETPLPNDLDSHIGLVTTPSAELCIAQCPCRQRKTTWKWLPSVMNGPCSWVLTANVVWTPCSEYGEGGNEGVVDGCTGTIYGPWHYCDAADVPSGDAKDKSKLETPSDCVCGDGVTWHQKFKRCTAKGTPSSCSWDCYEYTIPGCTGPIGQWIIGSCAVWCYGLCSPVEVTPPSTSCGAPPGSPNANCCSGGGDDPNGACCNTSTGECYMTYATPCGSGYTFLGWGSTCSQCQGGGDGGDGGTTDPLMAGYDPLLLKLGDKNGTLFQAE